MRRDQIVAHRGTQPHCNERRRARDHAVQHDRQAARCRAEVKARHARNIQPADLVQDVDRVIRGGPVQLERGLNGMYLAFQPLGGQARAAAGHVAHVGAGQHGGHRRARRGVADTHFATAHQPVTLRGAPLGHLDAGFERAHRLFPRHGGLFGHVRRAIADLAAQDALAFHVARHADIHREAVHADVFRHQADRGLAAAHVLGHRRGDLLSALGHALRDHAVVRAEHDDRALCDRRPHGALDGRELRDRVLQ